MKKVLLSVALLAGAFTFSFAQQKSVKEAKRIANGVVWGEKVDDVEDDE